MTLKYSPIWVRSVTQLAESLLVKKPGQVCWLCSVWLFSKNRGFYQWREQNVIFCNSNQKMFWFNNYVTKWLFAYSVYVDNFVSAYSVQKYYILYHATSSVFSSQPFFLNYVTTVGGLTVRGVSKWRCWDTNISASIHVWNQIFSDSGLH